MTPDNSYPVSYELTRVGADCEIYPAEGTWADPDVDDAAQAMRAVVERPDESRAKGEQARRRIEELYSPRAVGEVIRARLQTLLAMW
jgi:glycosyltransferase involved in cell wall biosynthesis